jgi:4-cresol dehydrogenase (hydroxylating) flavoprotein subunit
VAKSLESFLDDIIQNMGADAVNRRPETLRRYSENTMSGAERVPAAVIYPSSTADVQRMLKGASKFGVEIYPISTGNNIGLGSRCPSQAGQVVMDLGFKMNRILEVNDKLGYAVVEPGVSYQAMYDELVRLGNKWMLDTTSGPPQGGMIGNSLDKGAGYTPYFDHFAFACGMEVVLGNGDVIRTGDGALDQKDLVNFHASKYSFGPILDGLFTQSNYGIVTKMGVWLQPRPPHVESFHFAFTEDDDLEEIIDLIRPLKMSNFVPTLFRVSNDIYLCGSDEEFVFKGGGESPEYALSKGKRSISNEGRRALAAKKGVGSWTASGAFYGPSKAACAAQIQRVREHFERSGRGRYIDHESALKIPSLNVAICSFSGVPTSGELGLLKWRPGGGSLWFLPGTPMDGKITNEFQKVCRGIYERHGLDYTVMNVCGARFQRGLHLIIFNREDPDERRRADACYREMSQELVKRGVFVGRAPLDYHDMHMSQAMPAFKSACSSIKRSLDPHGVLAPGKYGIW